MDGNSTTKPAAGGVIDALCKVFERAIDDGQIKPEAMAIASGVGLSTLCRIRNREIGDMMLGTFVAVLRSLPPAQRQHWLDIIDPGFAHIERNVSESDLDLDGDGRVTIDDFLDAMADLCQHGGNMQHASREATRDHTLTMGEHIQLHAALNDQRRRMRLASAIAERVVVNRRQARPVGKIGGGVA